MIKTTGYADNITIHTRLCCDRSVCENWKMRRVESRGERKREQRGEKKKVQRGGSWPKLGPNRDRIVHSHKELPQHGQQRTVSLSVSSTSPNDLTIDMHLPFTSNIQTALKQTLLQFVSMYVERCTEWLWQKQQRKIEKATIENMECSRSVQTPKPHTGDGSKKRPLSWDAITRKAQV